MTQFEQYLRQVHARVSSRSFGEWFNAVDASLLMDVVESYSQTRYHAGQRDALETYERTRRSLMEKL